MIAPKPKTRKKPRLCTRYFFIYKTPCNTRRRTENGRFAIKKRNQGTVAISLPALVESALHNSRLIVEENQWTDPSPMTALTPPGW